MAGELRPIARFLGNSAGTVMDGGFTITIGTVEPRVYELNPPNAYARGILFGEMFMELGDSAKVSGEHYHCDVEFKTRV